MFSRNENFIWIDLEMTGLFPTKDRILEICAVITDNKFNIISECCEVVVSQPSELLANMDDWNTTQHTRSGLLTEVKNSKVSEEQAEAKILHFIQQYVDKSTSPMCGNSVYQDRLFLSQYMPTLAAYFHYRNFDVSTLKILAHNFAPDLAKTLVKQNNHRAKDDILESIAETRFYLANLFVMKKI